MLMHQHIATSPLIAHVANADNSLQKNPYPEAQVSTFGSTAIVRLATDGLAGFCAEYFSSTRRFLSWVFELKRT